MNRPFHSRLKAFLKFIGMVIILTGCASSEINQQSIPTSATPINDKVNVIATTTIVGDIVNNIAGELVNLDVLLPLGVDEHNYQYTPEDITKVAEAQLVFMNGAGLESFMEPLLKNVGKNTMVVSVSEGITLLQTGVDSHSGEPGPLDGDPHVWTDPANIKVWVENITTALSELDPGQAPVYRENADQYLTQLSELDAWIQGQVDQVPPENRLLVSDHQVFTYFAKRYGFDLIGALIPSYSTEAEPTAQELASLEDAIRQFHVKAIFVGNTINPSLAERVAADTHVKLVYVYTGSLTAGNPADTYLNYMKFNVSRLVEVLK